MSVGFSELSVWKLGSPNIQALEDKVEERIANDFGTFTFLLVLCFGVCAALNEVELTSVRGFIGLIEMSDLTEKRENSFFDCVHVFRNKVFKAFFGYTQCVELRDWFFAVFLHDRSLNVFNEKKNTFTFFRLDSALEEFTAFFIALFIAHCIAEFLVGVIFIHLLSQDEVVLFFYVTSGGKNKYGDLSVEINLRRCFWFRKEFETRRVVVDR